MVDSFTSSVFVWQNDTTSYFSMSLSLKFGACYITAQWGRVQGGNTTLCFHLLCRHFVVVVVFHHKICVSIIFNSFLDKASNFCYRILTNQKQKFVVKNCQWKCMPQYFLNWNIYSAYYVGLTLSDYCYYYAVFVCSIKLNWDIRLPSLCSFHISHWKIRSNTRINTLFQRTITRLRYITFTIAVVIQSAEKQFPWHKWLKN